MQNYNLLDEVGLIGKPVMVKRGLSASYEEWLLAAEYVMAGGNEQVILCERGVRGFETFTRFTLDVAAVPVIKRLSHLPIVADPSHSTENGTWLPPSPWLRLPLELTDCWSRSIPIRTRRNATDPSPSPLRTSTS
jgi:3-deoxy-7-phosphoheptulonate synthase